MIDNFWIWAYLALAAVAGAFVRFVFVSVFKKVFPTSADEAQPTTREYVLYGATLIDDGYDGCFPEWSSRMLLEFNELRRAQLSHCYEASRLLAQHPTAERRALVDQYLREDA